MIQKIQVRLLGENPIYTYDYNGERGEVSGAHPLEAAIQFCREKGIHPAGRHVEEILVDDNPSFETQETWLRFDLYEFGHFWGTVRIRKC